MVCLTLLLTYILAAVTSRVLTSPVGGRFLFSGGKLHPSALAYRQPAKTVGYPVHHGAAGIFGDPYGSHLGAGLYGPGLSSYRHGNGIGNYGGYSGFPVRAGFGKHGLAGNIGGKSYGKSGKVIKAGNLGLHGQLRQQIAKQQKYGGAFPTLGKQFAAVAGGLGHSLGGFGSPYGLNYGGGAYLDPLGLQGAIAGPGFAHGLGGQLPLGLGHGTHVGKLGAGYGASAVAGSHGVYGPSAVVGAHKAGYGPSGAVIGAHKAGYGPSGAIIGAHKAGYGPSGAVLGAHKGFGLSAVAGAHGGFGPSVLAGGQLHGGFRQQASFGNFGLLGKKRVAGNYGPGYGAAAAVGAHKGYVGRQVSPVYGSLGKRTRLTSY